MDGLWHCYTQIHHHTPRFIINIIINGWFMTLLHPDSSSYTQIHHQHHHKWMVYDIVTPRLSHFSMDWRSLKWPTSERLWLWGSWATSSWLWPGTVWARSNFRCDDDENHRKTIGKMVVLWDLMGITHLVMTHIAMETPRTKWWFIAGNIIYTWAIFHGYVI